MTRSVGPNTAKNVQIQNITSASCLVNACPVSRVRSVHSDAKSWAGPGVVRRVPLLCHYTATVTEPLERNRDVIHPTVLTRAFMNFISTIYCPINKM